MTDCMRASTNLSARCLSCCDMYEIVMQASRTTCDLRSLTEDWKASSRSLRLAYISSKPSAPASSKLRTLFKASIRTWKKHVEL